MSYSIPSDVSQIVGSIENHHITAKGENHYCCTWKIENIFSYLSKGELKSPIFTVSNRDECKWYLNLHCTVEGTGEIILICCSRLVLDRESGCEEASVKFKLTILHKEQKHECNLDSGRIFKFVKKSENSAGILSSVQTKHLYNRKCFCFMSIVCEMKIETSFPDADNISSDFGSLLEKQLFTDVVLSVGEKKFPAHKTILSVRSPVFAAMFAHNTTENQGVVHIKDMAGDVVEEMLRFIYTGDVEKVNDLAGDLLMAADKYDLKGLRIKCEKMLIHDLSSSNVVDLLALAKLHHAPELENCALNFFLKTAAEIMNEPAWKNLGQSDCVHCDMLKEICEAFMKSTVD